MSKLKILFGLLVFFILIGISKPEFLNKQESYKLNIALAAPVKNLAASNTKPATSSLPVSLSIPSIKLNSPIAEVGLNAKGAMDVLNSPTKVGWFKLGAKPGEIGSAVLDAHAYQAFKNLKKVKLGNVIQVQTQSGETLKFEVIELQVVAYTNTEYLDKIFNRKDLARLNLITCHGKWLPQEKTYSQRLIVYTKLIS